VNKLTNWEGFKEEITNAIQLSGPEITSYDVPQTAITKTATFADDTAVVAVQQDINAVNSWTKQWRIILNEIKSVHMNFSN
jgi:hypothetical protein